MPATDTPKLLGFWAGKYLIVLVFWRPGFASGSADKFHEDFGNNHDGTGYGFPASSTEVVNTEYADTLFETNPKFKRLRHG